MWLEVNKVKSPIASNLIGGALLGDILKRITKAVEAVNSNAPVSIMFNLLISKQCLFKYRKL